MPHVDRAKCRHGACFLFPGGAPRAGLSSCYSPAELSGALICLAAAHTFVDPDTPGVRCIDTKPNLNLTGGYLFIRCSPAGRQVGTSDETGRYAPGLHELAQLVDTY